MALNLGIKMNLNPNVLNVIEPPVSAAARLRALCPEDLELLDCSQAVPGYSPPEALIKKGQILLTAGVTHKYQRALGTPELRQAHATQLGITAEHVAITAGCNQAFAAALTVLARPGAEIIIPTPWYFNHAMTAQSMGLTLVPWPCLDDMSLDIDALGSLINDRTAGVIVVTPNNPTGRITTDNELHRVFDICRKYGTRLLLDETYRDFIAPDQRPTLFARSDWSDTLIQLYSFSKAFAIAGHRVGAMAANPTLLAQVEKVLDCWAICAPSLGQGLALHGLEHEQSWLTQCREEMQKRLIAIRQVFDDIEGITIRSAGAYFAWLEIDAADTSESIAQHWIEHLGILAIPGAHFSAQGPELRLAFANLDTNGIETLGRRLSQGPISPSQ